MQQDLPAKSTLVDLRAVQAPYIRLMGEHYLSMSGATRVQHWELRFVQPNLSHLSEKAMHSLEHLLAKYVPRYMEQVLEVSPMGCATGFRLLVAKEFSFEDISNGLQDALEDILEAPEIPAIEPWRCGRSEYHSLEEAQGAAANFLAGAKRWNQVVPLAY